MEEGVEVASGPPYTQPEDNPKEFKGLKQEFVPGRPHECFAAWEKMRPACDKEVLAWIRDMYEVKEHEEALGLTCKNGKEARSNPEALQTILIKRLRERSYEFAKEGVKNLVPVNLVEKLSASPPWRLVVNAREMNKAYKVWRTKYEGVHTVPLTVKKRDWLFSVDLYSGYDAILLQPKSRQLYGVKVVFSKENIELLRAEGLVEEAAVLREFKDGSVEVLLQPRTLVQGWVNSCAAFTKIARQLARMWRAKGFRLANILDDFLFSVSGTFEEACAVRDEVLRDMTRLGFYVSWAKSVLLPSRIFKFMGVLVDSDSMRFHMPGDKIEKLEQLIRSFLVGPTRVAYRKMASVTRKILSMSCAVLCARMFTRETYRCIRPEGDWDALGEITEEMIEELREALKWVRIFNAKGAPIRRPARQLGLRLMMDASRGGYGYRLDGEQRDVKWGEKSYMVAAQW